MQEFVHVVTALCCVLFLCGFVFFIHSEAKASDKIVRDGHPPQPDYDAAIPETISGVVYDDANRNGVRDAGEKGIAGVSVSDGYSVVSTDEQGRYTLAPSEKAVFVQITRPSGYDPVGHWYQPISPEVDFALAKSGQDETEFIFIQVTDTHISGSPVSLDGLDRFVKEVNELDPQPLFVLNTGDLVNCTKQLTTPVPTARSYFDSYTGTMSKLRMPHYNVAGDHTDVGYRMEQFPRGDFRCGKAMYWEYMGPNLYSFEYGKLHFVSLDMVYHLSEKPSFAIIPEHLRWLKEDLEHRSPGTVVLTGSETTLMKSIPEFYELGEEYDIELQLYGDKHIVSYDDTPVPARCGGALSGTWWSGECCDLSPQGYLIYQVRGDELDCFYKGLGEQVSINAPAFGTTVRGKVDIRAHLVQGQSEGPLEYSVDGENWELMRETEPSFYRKNYVADFDSTPISDGLINLRARTKDSHEIKEIPVIVNNNKEGFTAGSNATLMLKVSKLSGGDVRNKPPSGEVKVIFNDKEVGAIFDQKTYDIPIMAENLKKVNHLTFRFSEPDDGIEMMEPALEYGGETLYDPRQAAIRNARMKSWLKSVMDVMGVRAGKGNEDSLAIRQNDFYFVLP